MKSSLPAGGLIVPVGSRVTCSPPPTDTDEDFLVLVEDRSQAVAALQQFGFEAPTNAQQIMEYNRLGMTSGWNFSSLRLGDVNYIVTDDVFFFERFLTASHVAKSLNILSKHDRIMVFEAMRGASFAGHFWPQWRASVPGDAFEVIGEMGRERWYGPAIEAKLMLSVRDNDPEYTPF